MSINTRNMPIMDRVAKLISSYVFLDVNRGIGISSLLAPLVLGVFAVYSSHSLSSSYGIYDPRALAMGGTTVAAATPQHAQFYNPALLALTDGREEDTRKGRYFFPSLVVQGTDSTEGTIDVIDQGYDDQLTNAVNVYNANPNAQTAGGVATAARDFDNAIEELVNQDLAAEGFFGMSVSEPSDREGGSFYLGIRLLGGGSSNVSDADLALVDDYIEAMDFIATGVGDPHLELFDADGNLIDPRATLNSSADVSALVIAEWGVAIAREFTFFGQPIAMGLTPKIMRVDVVREDLRISDADFSYPENKELHFALNADFGVAAQFGEHFRVGVAVKDLLEKSFASQDQGPVTLAPRTRLGIAYENRYLTAGLDVDLTINKPIALEPESQDVSIGIELRPLKFFDIRLGYRQDLEGNRSDVISGGLGFLLGPVAAEFSYSQSEDTKGAGLQFGYAF